MSSSSSPASQPAAGPKPPARVQENLSGALLVTGAAGCGKSTRALQWIRATATEPGRRGAHVRMGEQALLVLPTYAQVTRARRLALTRWNARGVLDDPFATFTSVGERFLPSFRVRALPTPQERDRLMEEALRRAAIAHFERVRDRPGFRARLLQLVKELKQTGEDAQTGLARLNGACSQLTGYARLRLEGFVRVLGCYEELLRTAGLKDHEDTLRELALALEASVPAALPSLLVVDGFDDFTPIEERILLTLTRAVLAGQGAVRVTLPFDAARPLLFAQSASVRARLLAAGFGEERMEGFLRSPSPPLQALAERLFAAPEPGAPGAIPGGQVVQSEIAGDGPDEADRVARAVRAWVQRAPKGEARHWRDVLVIARHLGENATQIEAAFERLGIPLRTVGWAPSLAAAPAVRALRGPLDVLRGQVGALQFQAVGLTEWLRWCALAQDREDEARAIDAWEIQQRTKGFAPTFETFVATAPTALRERVQQLAMERARLAQAGRGGRIHDELFAALAALLPLPTSKGLDEQGRPRDAQRDRRRAQAAGAVAGVRAVLERLAETARRTGIGVEADVASAARELIEALEITSPLRPDRRLDAVSLVDAEEARFWEAPFVVVCGLEEGVFPLRPREDVLLRDHDRRRLAQGEQALRLPLAADREVRERRLFYGALTRASRQLLLVRRGYDEEGRIRPASLLLRDVERVVAPTPLAAPRAAGHVDLILAECFTVADLRLFAAGALRPRPWESGQERLPERQLAAALLAAGGGDAPRRAALHHRRLCAPLGAEERPLRTALRARLDEISVSDVELAAGCSMRFYLERLLNLRADVAPLAGPTLDVRVEGHALHRAFELALRQAGTSVSELADTVVREERVTGIPARRLRDEIVRAVELLLDREAASQSAFRPFHKGLELTFEGPSAIALGEGEGAFRLRGRIDRVDRAGHAAMVVDYKSSAGGVDRNYKDELAGRGLQLSLYGLAVEKLLGLEVVGLEWIAQRVRERRAIYATHHETELAVRREGMALHAESAEEFRQRLGRAEQRACAAVAGLRRAELLRKPINPKDCSTCAVQTVCRPDQAWIYAEHGAGPLDEEE